MTAIEVVAALEKALSENPTPGEWSQAHRPSHEGMHVTEVFDVQGETIAAIDWLPRPTVDGVTATYREANALWIAAANPLAIRTLLDAHASALRDAAKLRKALSGMCSVWKTVCDSKGWEPGHVSQYIQARSALDDNTKGAAE